VEAQEISEGIWFPRNVSLKKGGISSELAVQSVDVNVSFSPDDFALAAFAMNNEQTTLLRFGSGGERVECHFVGGEWIPTTGYSSQAPSKGDAE